MRGTSPGAWGRAAASTASHQAKMAVAMIRFIFMMGVGSIQPTSEREKDKERVRNE